MKPEKSKTDQALAVLKTAIQTETEGIRFYTQAAERTDDPAGKEFFGSLAAEELEHRQLLETQLAARQAGQGWRKHTALKAPIKRARLFTPGRLKRDVDAHTSDLSALRIALTIESSAVAFYSQAAEQSDDDQARAMFRDLAQMEQAHEATLQREYDFLLGQFREDMGFAPF
jgi:rubrerythrin